MLVLSRHKNEKVMIGDDVVVVVSEIRGDKVSLGFEAPKGISVHRQEVYDAIKRNGSDHAHEASEEGGEIILEERAIKLRDQILKTWNPPLTSGDERKADIAQTSVMLSLAFVFGSEFLGPLTSNQQVAITSGLALFEKVIG